jgi:hypothetical protein
MNARMMHPLQSGTVFSYVDVEQGVFADQPCETCAACPSVVRVTRWRCPDRSAGTVSEPIEGEMHSFCAEHHYLADALSHRLSDA